MLLVLAVALIAVKYRAIEHGAAEVARVLALAAIAVICLAVAAVAALAARRYRRRTVRVPETRSVLPVVIRHLGPPGRPAIEPRASVRESAAYLADLRREPRQEVRR